MTPSASAQSAAVSETAPNTPAVPLVNKSGRRLTAAERAALTPTAQVDPKAAHDLLANKEQINPAENGKPVRGASVQKNRKGADPKPSKSKTAPKSKAAPKAKADKAPKEPKVRVVRPTGVLRAHPDQRHGDGAIPCDLNVNRETLDKFRATLGKGETFGEAVRGWADKLEDGSHVTPLPTGRDTRTVYLNPEQLARVQKWEAKGHRFADYVYAKLLNATK
jgi:hypothetical protein